MMRRTEIVKSVDKSKCPHCGSGDIFYFEKEGVFWCPKCKKAYQYEEFERDINEPEEIEEWEIIEE